MKKKITQINREKLDKLFSALDNTDNVVPFIMKTTFNFKGRKSPLVAGKALQALTSPEDIIYDPFMGSGSFVIAAAQCDRKIVATELDNYTYSAVYALLAEVDFKKMKQLFSAVEAEAKAAVMYLYETQCCGTKNYIAKLYFDPQNQKYFSPRPNREIKDGKNVKFVSPCPICGKKEKQFEQADMQKLKNTSDQEIETFPKDKYMENSRINITAATGADRYDRIFTKRSQKALLLIQNAILKLQPCIERDVLEQALVSSLSLARISMYGSSTDILYHVVPYGAQEMNVWLLFESKVNSFLEFKKEYRRILTKNPQQGENYRILNLPYQEFCRTEVPDGSYDLIYTDFPYTDQVPYLERNQLYRIWLNRFYDEKRFQLTPQMLKAEIVLTDSPERKNKRSLAQYYSDIDEMFRTFYRILKERSLVIFTTKLGKNKYFTTLMEIINLARKNGFEYAFRIGIDKNDPTIRKQSAYKNTLSNEMMIVFEKLDEQDRYWYVRDRNYEFETVRLIYQLVQKEEVTLTGAVGFVRDALLNKEAYIASEEDLLTIQKIIAAHFIVERGTSIVRIDTNKLYLDIEDNTDLFTKFYNYIPVIIRKLLEDKGKFVLDDLYFQIANTLCTGDPKTINQFLENSRYASDIKKLIRNYCSLDGKVYEKRSFTFPVSDDAIDISTLEGKELELLIKALLEADGFYDVINTGGSGDLGVDLLAKKLDSDGVQRIYLFQCKRWIKPVGSTPMQRLVAERARRNADYAICVTTSDYSKDGIKISREQDIDAWNGEDVVRKLNQHFPGRYYNSLAAK